MTENLNLLGKQSWYLNINGFCGTIDNLLVLARKGKIELEELLMKELADQYLALISKTNLLDLTYAMNSILQAISLVFMKSNDILPRQNQTEQEQNIDEKQEKLLKWRIEKIRIMQQAIKKIYQGNILAKHIFSRKCQQSKPLLQKNPPDIKLIELLKAYKTKKQKLIKLKVRVLPVISLQQAFENMKLLLNESKKWITFENLLCPCPENYVKNSEIASAFVAALFLAREGNIVMKQQKNFGVLYIKSAQNA